MVGVTMYPGTDTREQRETGKNTETGRRIFHSFFFFLCIYTYIYVAYIYIFFVFFSFFFFSESRFSNHVLSSMSIRLRRACRFDRLSRRGDQHRADKNERKKNKVRQPENFNQTSTCLSHGGRVDTSAIIGEALPSALASTRTGARSHRIGTRSL